jgi:hypothetical protein
VFCRGLGLIQKKCSWRKKSNKINALTFCAEVATTGYFGGQASNRFFEALCSPWCKPRAWRLANSEGCEQQMPKQHM